MLVERHRPMALAVVGRVLPDGGAVDVVQEAAVTAYVGLDRLRAPDRFGSWFTGIGLNTARRWLRDALRYSAPFPDRQGDEPYPHSEGDELDPAEGALRADIARRIREAVAHLAPGQRDAVLAFYWLGLSHADGAAELGASRSGQGAPPPGTSGLGDVSRPSDRARLPRRTRQVGGRPDACAK